MASSGDGIGNWASDVAIDPFNSAQIMHTYGGGIWATNNGTSTTTLTAPNSWYFPDTGIEMTAILGLAASTGGTPLFSAMGDVGGFAFTTLAFSPEQGNVYANGGNGTSVDSAGLDPQDAALVGNMGTTYGFYTTNGTTFTAFAANPGGSQRARVISQRHRYRGRSRPMDRTHRLGVRLHRTVQAAVLTPRAYNGTVPSWTHRRRPILDRRRLHLCRTGGIIVSDKVNPNYFYYWTENSNDNSWTLYISTNGGETFALSAGGSLGTGNVDTRRQSHVAGQLWISSYIGSMNPRISAPASITIGS